jgi:hypothetical protein
MQIDQITLADLSAVQCSATDKALLGRIFEWRVKRNGRPGFSGRIPDDTTSHQGEILSLVDEWLRTDDALSQECGHRQDARAHRSQKKDGELVAHWNEVEGGVALVERRLRKSTFAKDLLASLSPPPSFHKKRPLPLENTFKD